MNTDHTCIICPVLHPTSDPQWADVGQSCAGDYGLITSWLKSLPELHATLITPERFEPDRRVWWSPWLDRSGRQIVVDGQVMRYLAPSDPVGSVLPVGPVRAAAGNQPRVSGSRERPLGVRMAPLDLMLPVATVDYLRRAPAATDTLVPLVRRWQTKEMVQLEGEVAPREVAVWHRELAYDPAGYLIYIPAGDQTGPQPTARWLDRTVQHWLLNGAPGRRLPAPEVPDLVQWLLNRVDWAVVDYPLLDEFAVQLRQVRGALNRVLDLNDTQPQRCPGVPCDHCHNVTLYRLADCVECDHCGKRFSDDAFEELRDVHQRNRRRKKAA